MQSDRLAGIDKPTPLSISAEGCFRRGGVLDGSDTHEREGKGASVMRRKIPVLVSLTFLMVSCGLNPFNSDKPDPDDRFYQILVDSVTVGSPLRVFDPPQGTLRTLLKSPLAVSDIMHVRFYGGIGPNLCHGFSHIDTTRIDLVGYKVSLWGKQNLRSPVCPGIVSELYPEWNRDHILEFYPPLRVGTWIFLVSQPDGSVLRKEAVVR